ncbi:hypothetical protein ACAW74_22995 [Fibrella sp. WM1]
MNTHRATQLAKTTTCMTLKLAAITGRHMTTTSGAPPSNHL